MEIVVTGRNVEVPEHFRVHLTDKVTRLERYDHKIIALDVELFHEPNRRQLKNCQRVELTGRGRSGVARAEACAQDFYAALDAAVAKLEGRLRRSHDRRSRARRTRVLAGHEAQQASAGSAAQVGTAVLDDLPPVDGVERLDGFAPGDVPGPRDPAEPVSDGFTPLGDGPEEGHGHDYSDRWADGDPDPEPGRIVRRKTHSAEPMSVDDALSQMELVGHDFYLFADAESGAPSVVYRRRGYDYGVIRLGR